MDVLKVTILWIWLAVNLPLSEPVLQGSPRKDVPVRLVDGLTLFHGWAEALVDGQWGGVCGDGWGMNDAKVLCRQLGSPGVLLTFTGAREGGAVALGQLDCKGSEAGLADCRQRPRASCSKRRAATRCLSTALPVRNQEIVQMLYDGRWLPVCQSTESVAAAQVLCRQLDLPHLVSLSAVPVSSLSSSSLSASSPPSGVKTVGGDDDRFPAGRLYLNLVCGGQEASLSQCPSRGPRDTPCLAAQAVCSKEDEGKPGGVIRLSETEDSGATGRLLVEHGGQGWAVCSRGLGLEAAALACRQLGYRSATAVRPKMAMEADAIGRKGFDQVICRGDEASFEDCQHTLDTSNVCPSGTVAEIECNNTEVTILSDYQVRLVGGSFPYEGRVEVSIGGRWGTVCDDGWGYADADVVCQQLGYFAAEAVASTAYFGEGAGPILLDDVACVGNESSLAHCPHAGPGQHNCNHKEDAGVRCYENKTMFTLLPSEKNDSILPLIVILINGLIALLILFGCLIYCYLKIWDRYTGRAQRAAEHRRGQGAGAGLGDPQSSDIPLEFTEEPPAYHTVQQNRSIYIAPRRPETPPPEYSEAMKLQAEGCV